MQTNIYRELKSEILVEAQRKLILISGPRQCGKITLEKSLSESFEYLNYDGKQDRKKIMDETWVREKEYLILDEIHKMKK